MPSIIKTLYSEEDIKIARFAKAPGHPVRIAIFPHISIVSTSKSGNY